MKKDQSKHQIILLDLIKQKLPHLKPKRFAKKLQEFPANTILKSPDGWLWIVENSTYKAVYNDYWLFLRPYITSESCSSISMLESRLKKMGYMILEKGGNA